MLLRRASLLALVALSAACTVVLARERRQCQIDADCVDLGFREALCSNEGLCRGVNVRQTDAAQPTSCRTNADCRTILAEGVGRCVSNACISLVNEDCTEVYGATDRDDATFVGVLTPTKGPAQSLGRTTANIVRVAIESYATTVAGSSGLSAQPIVAVACDETTNVGRAIDHLAGAVGARAIIGPLDEQRFLDVTAAATTRRIPFFSPYASSRALAERSGKGGLVWSCSPSALDAERFFADALAPVKAAVLTRDGRNLTSALVFAAKDPASSRLADAITTTYGGSLSSVRKIEYDSPLQGAAPDYPKLAAFATGTTAYDLVVSASPGTGDFGQILKEIEGAWPAGRARPYYLLWQRNTRVAINAAVTLSGTSGGTHRAIHERVFVIDNARPDTTFYEDALSNFRAKVSGPVPVPDEKNELAFDCGYVVAYALHAAQRGGNVALENVGGAQIQEAIVRLSTDGARTHGLGVDPIAEAFPALNLGQAIDVYGASGPLDFDIVRGSPRAGGELWCLEPDPTRANFVRHRRAAVSFGDRGAIGTVKCGSVW
jgi:hypothetical protein